MINRLQELILPGNEFRTVPQEILQLRKIVRLSLARNGIKAIPPEMGQLTTLTELDLSHNSIAELPAQVQAVIIVVLERLLYRVILRERERVWC